LPVVPVRPAEDSWIAAVHATETDPTPLGSALLIDTRRLLTCRHVVTAAGTVRPEIWVEFPNAGSITARMQVANVRLPARTSPDADAAVLWLAEPVPEGVVAARLRDPEAGDLREQASRWWAFGFPQGDPLGNSADGTVGEKLAFGWVRLDTDSRYLVQPGFSGGGLWSEDYQAVVAIVGQANNRGDGQALTLRRIADLLPDEKIDNLAAWSVEAVDEIALAAWSWSLAADVEATRHWRPRARGVAVDAERGFRFQGRTRALSEIVAWLERPTADSRILVVTGSPGVGKSAVLGRIVTTADAETAAALPTEDRGVRAPVGSVACAVHAKGKSALDVALEIARASSAALPDDVDDLPPALRQALERAAGRDRGGFTVVVDALDEAVNPGEARRIITRVVLPIAATCADLGARVVLGTRRTDAQGDLLRPLGPARVEIDLDLPAYFALEDLTAYAKATLQLRGQERPDSPYLTDETACPDRVGESDRPGEPPTGLWPAVSASEDPSLLRRAPGEPPVLAQRASVSGALVCRRQAPGPHGRGRVGASSRAPCRVLEPAAGSTRPRRKGLCDRAGRRAMHPMEKEPGCGDPA
jgi:hypothetical protein